MESKPRCHADQQLDSYTPPPRVGDRTPRLSLRSNWCRGDRGICAAPRSVKKKKYRCREKLTANLCIYGNTTISLSCRSPVIWFADYQPQLCTGEPSFQGGFYKHHLKESAHAYLSRTVQEQSTPMYMPPALENQQEQGIETGKINGTTPATAPPDAPLRNSDHRAPSPRAGRDRDPRRLWYGSDGRGVVRRACWARV